MEDLAGGAVGAVLGGGLLARIWRRRAERLRDQQSSELGLRVRSGQGPRLLRRWRHGRARLRPGSIVFEPYGPLGIRFRRPWTDPIEIEVRSVRPEIRWITGLETWWASGVVHEITTPDAVIEMVCGHLQDHEWVLAQIRPLTGERGGV